MNTAFVQRSVPLVINALVMMACLFGAAGRVTWGNGWVLIALSFLTGVAAQVVVNQTPALAAERRNLRAGEAWDKALVGFTVLLGPTATWITAGIAARRGAAGMSPSATFAGVIISAAGGALVVWAMHANAFFSAVVRIQRDRGHTVVTSGPYRLVRHPGYAGMSLFMLATPLILSSWWALIPVAATIAMLVLRTLLEDRLLRRDLDGYADYAAHVKARLVPGVW